RAVDRVAAVPGARQDAVGRERRVRAAVVPEKADHAPRGEQESIWNDVVRRGPTRRLNTRRPEKGPVPRRVTRKVGRNRVYVVHAPVAVGGQDVLPADELLGRGTGADLDELQGAAGVGVDLR